MLVDGICSSHIVAAGSWPVAAAALPAARKVDNESVGADVTGGTGVVVLSSLSKRVGRNYVVGECGKLFFSYLVNACS